MAGPRAPTEVPGGALKTWGQQGAGTGPVSGRHRGQASTPQGRCLNTSCQPSGAGLWGKETDCPQQGGGGLFRKMAPQESQPIARGGATLAGEHTGGQNPG